MPMSILVVCIAAFHVVSCGRSFVSCRCVRFFCSLVGVLAHCFGSGSFRDVVTPPSAHPSAFPLSLRRFAKMQKRQGLLTMGWFFFRFPK